MWPTSNDIWIQLMHFFTMYFWLHGNAQILSKWNHGSNITFSVGPRKSPCYLIWYRIAYSKYNHDNDNISHMIHLFRKRKNRACCYNISTTAFCNRRQQWNTNKDVWSERICMGNHTLLSCCSFQFALRLKEKKSCDATARYGPRLFPEMCHPVHGISGPNDTLTSQHRIFSQRF